MGTTTETTALTATELHKVSPEFRALIASWVETRVVPFGLGDFLEEQGLDRPAACARWGIEIGERGVFITELTGHLGLPPRSGVYPSPHCVKGDPTIRSWSFFITRTQPEAWCDGVYPDNALVRVEKILLTPTACILNLLDNWK